MESLSQYKKTLNKKIKMAISDGDVFRANEIEANMLLGTVLLIMSFITILCLILNEVGVFSVAKNTMRYSVVAVLLIMLPIVIVNKKTHGEPKWMKTLLETGIILVCGILSSTLAYNVVLVIAVPIVLSQRYSDAKFTKNVAFASALVFLLATLGNAYFGLLDLNMYDVMPGTTLHVTDTLRIEVKKLEIDRWAYFIELLVNEYLPKMLIFAVVAFSCIKVAQRGREMTELQDEIATKASRIETELNLATEIQAGMLPCVFPAFPDHGELELFATNVPAKEVGGDFYDYFKIDDDHVAVVMADVSGKGVGAALFMTISKIVIKNQMMTTKSPAAALTEANRQLCENNDAGLFVTTWSGIFEVSSGELTYTNAGHNPPIIIRKDGTCEYLKGINGLFLAGMEGTQYSESKVTLNKGDELFLYTDGVTEATSTQNELYAEDRLLSCIENHAGDTVKKQVQAVLDDVNIFIGNADQFDDITMLGIKIHNYL